MSLSLHIVSFDIPYPADYGGVIDVFYKVRALTNVGVNIRLHCFHNGRKPAAELEKYCSQVHYYPRNYSKWLHFRPQPFIVSSRAHPDLPKNLLKDGHPILFEGLHTCYYLSDPRFKDRLKLVRTHNIEHHYYRSLALTERKPIKRNFFRLEARKLKRFESTLRHADHILAISPNDQAYFSEKFDRVQFLPAFHNNCEDHALNGRGTFALYHGNLGVAENNKAALYLIHEVFKGSHLPLIIAGSNPTPQLQEIVVQHPNIELKENIEASEVDELVSQAQVNILPTFQSTGIKLKLLSALFKGRHCLVNEPMVKDTGLEEFCHIENDPRGMKEKLHTLMEQPYSNEELEMRKKTLENTFSNARNAEKIKALLKKHPRP